MHRTVFSFIGVVSAIEVLLLGLCIIFPGEHSPILYSQPFVLWLTNAFDPGIGSCITCAPAAQLVLGAALQVLVMFLVAWAAWRLILHFKTHPV